MANWLPVAGWLVGVHRLRLAVRWGFAILLVLAPGAVSQAQTPASFRTEEFNANWGLGVIGADYAYSMGYTGAGVKLGIADGAFQFTHPEFAGRIYYPAVFPAFPLPGLKVPDHGTHVMGLASAARNSIGMMGVAFDSRLAGVIAVNDEEGYPAAGDWAGELIKAGVSVMNGSFGPDALPPRYLDDGSLNPTYAELGYQALSVASVTEDLSAIQRLSQADVVMVFAAGNDYQNQPIATRFPLGAGMVPLITPANTRAESLYRFVVEDPSSDPNNPATWRYEPIANVEAIDGSSYAGTLIAVVAIDRNNQIADFSNRCGVAADWCLAAPGVDLYSSVPMNIYANMSGTSMASPLVAGSAAVVRQAFPYMTARQVIEVLLTTATDLGSPEIYGHGLLSLQRAVKGPVQFGHPSLVTGNDSIFAPVFAVDTKGYNSVWSNDISGVGGLSKAGQGMLTLSGTNTYTGTTTVTGGVLRVDGSIANSYLTVGPAATLQGTGIVGETLIQGTLAPGNSIGTLTVDGDIEFVDGSVYLFEVDDQRQTDLLIVNGNVVIDDRAIFKLAADDGVLLDSPYTIIDADSVQGTFEVLHAEFTFIELNFSAVGDDLLLEIERNDVPMSAFAQTNNQRAVADAIDAQDPGDEPYNEALLNDLPADLASLYQDWSGEIYSANQAALLYSSRILAQVVNWRLHDSWLPNPQSARLQQLGQTNADTTVWAQAYGNWDQFSANADAQKATANSGGFVLGVDHKISPSLRLGGGFSASLTETEVAASEASTTGYHLLAYGTYDNGHLRLNGGLVQSWNVASVNRTLSRDDQGNATGTVASNSTQLFADLSTPLPIHRQHAQRTMLWPFAQVSQMWLRTANFGETGAEAALSGQSTNASAGFGTLGARLTHEWQTGEISWQTSLSAGWQRAWGDLSPTTTLAFAAGPAFTVAAAPIARDAAVIELGLGASLGPSSRLSLVYWATVAGQSSSQMLQARLQWAF